MPSSIYEYFPWVFCFEARDLIEKVQPYTCVLQLCAHNFAPLKIYIKKTSLQIHFVPNFKYIYIYIEGRHANTKTQEAVDHLASFMSGTKEVLQPGLYLVFQTHKSLGWYG